jgi:serine kinase of HPr protein (carbohydrate metabolism regulator)
VLPIYFSIAQKYRFLHAGAVEVEEKAILFMAPSFGGKSTLTDYFIQRGHPLITDDKLATFERDGNFYAVPSHPYHRPFRTVEVLGHLCANPATHVRPIHAIYILEKGEPDGEIAIRKLKGVEKFSRLHEGGEMNFSFFTPQYVTYLARLANHVHVFNVTVPHDLKRLEEVYQAIKEHTNTL